MKTPRRLLCVSASLLCFAGYVLRAAEPAPAAPHGYTVTVEIRVSETGEPEHVTVVSSDDTTTGDIVTKMAVAMALKSQLTVRQKNGVPAKYTARVPFVFPIEDDEGAASNDWPKPKVKEAIQPAYPLDLRERGVVGGAILELVIDADGKIARLTTLRASHPEFETAALESVKKWTFVPALKDGKPVESRSRVAVVFETETAMADLKWRVAPRPSLGSFTVIKPDQSREEPAEAPASAAPSSPAAAK